MKCWKEKGRITVVTGRLKSFIKEIQESSVYGKIPLNAEAYVTDERLKLESTIDLPRVPMKQGEIWGRNWQSAYFTLECDVQEEYLGKDTVLQADLGGEVLIYSEDGHPLFGLTDESAMDPDYTKTTEPITLTSSHIKLYAEVAANNLFGLNRTKVKKTRNIPEPEGRHIGTFSYAYIGILDKKIHDLHIRMDALFSLYNVLEKDSLKAVRVLSALFEAMKAYSVSGVDASLAIVDKELAKPSEATSLSVTAIGHAHIDTAWLWPLAETHRKVMRTFSSQIRNLERYPGYVFGASSPQQYQWVKDEHPRLYEEIREMIGKGRWELLGAMWLEPDCNLVSGESLVRQIVEGKEFFSKEFGKNVRTCWIPDVFGYPASLPQILAKSGIPYFSTQKISWSLSNQFPYDSFIWEGIDGSRVIAHFLPEHTYNSSGNFGTLRKGQESFLEKDRLDEFVSAVGIGDGGGGPKAEHIERVLVAKDTEGVPKTQFGFVEEFFDRLEAERNELEVYRGELYLEFHRGTYTSQAKNKKCNRIFEEALKPVEVLSYWMGGAGERLKNALHDGLMFQFHDILPGSCIGSVYRETDDGYGKIFAAFSSIVEDYIRSSGAGRFAFSSAFGSVKSDGKMKYLNVFSFSPSEMPILVELPDASIPEDAVIAGSAVQRYGEKAYAYLPIAHAGWNTFDISASGKKAEPAVEKDCLVLENSKVRYEFDKSGHLVKGMFLDSGFVFTYGREGNLFRYFADEPHTYDAWDVEYYYPEMECAEVECISAERSASGLAFSALHFTYKVESSVIEQHVYLTPDSAALSFRTRVDWHAEKRYLRVYFPCDGMIDECTCDIPYGELKRKTHVQNEWDAAKFEFPARLFVDVSDGKGVALSCDSKYGYSVRNGEIGLSLLRSPLDPDPNADQGEHEFTYALIPHEQALAESSVRAIATELSSVHLSVLTEQKASFSDLPLDAVVSGDNLELTVFKAAEDGNGAVVRVVETGGKHVEGHIAVKSGSRVFECNLLEQSVSDAIDFTKAISFKPYEIKTFRIVSE